MKIKSNLFEQNFYRSLKRNKMRIVHHHKRALREDALSDALGDDSQIGQNQVLSDVLGDIQQQAEENQKAEAQLQRMVDRQNVRINDIITTWADQLHEFIKFINDPENNSSMKTVLDQAAPDSVFEKIKISQSKPITRIAQSVSSLEQALRSYVIGGIDEEGLEEDITPEPEQPTTPEQPSPEEEEFDDEL